MERYLEIVSFSAEQANHEAVRLSADYSEVGCYQVSNFWITWADRLSNLGE